MTGRFRRRCILPVSCALRPINRFAFVQPAGFTKLYQFDYHKVEAFDFVPGADGGLVFGTDDENLGAAILLTY